jgi:hypothetical protein
MAEEEEQAEASENELTVLGQAVNDDDRENQVTGETPASTTVDSNGKQRGSRQRKTVDSQQASSNSSSQNTQVKPKRTCKLEN